MTDVITHGSVDGVPLTREDIDAVRQQRRIRWQDASILSLAKLLDEGTMIESHRCNDAAQYIVGNWEVIHLLITKELPHNAPRTDQGG